MRQNYFGLINVYIDYDYLCEKYSEYNSVLKHTLKFLGYPTFNKVLPGAVISQTNYRNSWLKWVWVVFFPYLHYLEVFAALLNIYSFIVLFIVLFLWI